MIGKSCYWLWREPCFVRDGAARTGAYFSTAPFIGAADAVVALGESLTPKLIAGGALIGVGLWLHLTERHEHMHVHDLHHQHQHMGKEPLGEPHSHFHVHAHIRHGHPHYPDAHHRHNH